MTTSVHCELARHDSLCNGLSILLHASKVSFKFPSCQVSLHPPLFLHSRAFGSKKTRTEHKNVTQCLPCPLSHLLTWSQITAGVCPPFYENLWDLVGIFQWISPVLSICADCSWCLEIELRWNPNSTPHSSYPGIFFSPISLLSPVSPEVLSPLFLRR